MQGWKRAVASSFQRLMNELMNELINECLSFEKFNRVLIVMLLALPILYIEIAMAEISVGYEKEDLLIAKIARERTYPGGRDEEDLEVQAQFIKPIRKEMSKNENTLSPTSNDDEF